MSMIDAVTDHLIILLNTLHSIRSNVFNEITRFNSKSLYRRSDEALIKFQSSVTESEVDKLMNDAERATEVNFVIHKNDENLLHQKKESKIFEETQNFPGTKKNDVLKTLKLRLEDSLRFVEVLRQNVTEQITIVNNERNSLQSENNEMNSDSKVIINKSPTKENVETTKTFNNDESDGSTIVKSEPLETFGKNHENVMISLISDDDSDSDCIEISVTDTISDTINPDQFVPIKLENISHFQNNYTKRTASTKINEIVTEEQSNKRKLDEHEKTAKKKKKSRDKSASLVNLFGEFHKVKLSNLSAGITYEEIASLLKNSGLEFLDILLMNGGEKSVAEISFADIQMKEKALAMDPPLFHGGMKIRIKSL